MNGKSPEHRADQANQANQASVAGASGTHSLLFKEAVVWTPTDEAFATHIFRRGQEPCQGCRFVGCKTGQKLFRMVDLDYILGAFELHIGYSDAGFNNWIWRHKCAIDLHLTPEPKVRQYRISKDHVHCVTLCTKAMVAPDAWDDKVWYLQYAYVVKMRCAARKELLRSSGLYTDKFCRLMLRIDAPPDRNGPVAERANWLYRGTRLRPKIKACQPGKLNGNWQYSVYSICCEIVKDEASARALTNQFWQACDALLLPNFFD